MKFTDHFSAHAEQYARSRPDYPQDLILKLVALAPGTTAAWDCAAGSGQAARPLARHFDVVYATDVSFRQLHLARVGANVHRHVAAAEASAMKGRSIDLVVVAQALHWFDTAAFFGEVRRVMKADGIFAAWCYQRMQICAEVDRHVRHYRERTVGAYWPGERRHVENGYQTIHLPLVEEPLSGFGIEKWWDLSQLVDYVRSWSATQRFLRANGRDPADELRHRLLEVWGPAGTKRRVRWPLAVRAGRLIR